MSEIVPSPGTKKLGVMGLAILAFYSVSGGPFGIEDAVSAGGPLLAIFGFLIFPFIWSFQEALVCTELATAYPEASGYVAWVNAAFGPYWAFQEGWLSWLSGVTDNSLYPVLFLDYLAGVFDIPELETGITRWLFLFGFTFIFTYFNYRGLEVVSWVSYFICFVSLVPFVLLVLVAAPKVDTSRLTMLPEGGWDNVDWVTLLNILFWNLNYWDACSSLSGEVQNPGRTFPRGYAIAILLVLFSVTAPLIVGIGADRGPIDDWHDGYLVEVAKHSVGVWLAGMIVFGAAASNIGLFMAEMSTDSYRVMGMAELGMLPAFLTKKSRYGTPINGILLSSVGIVALVSLTFTEIISMVNFLYCFAELLEFVAFLKLRISKPDVPRPFKVPVSTKGAFLMLFPTIFFILVMIIMADSKTWIVCIGFVLLGLLMPTLMGFLRRRNLVEFITIEGMDYEPNINFSCTRLHRAAIELKTRRNSHEKANLLEA